MRTTVMLTLVLCILSPAIAQAQIFPTASQNGGDVIRLGLPDGHLFRFSERAPMQRLLYENQQVNESQMFQAMRTQTGPVSVRIPSFGSSPGASFMQPTADQVHAGWNQSLAPNPYNTDLNLSCIYPETIEAMPGDSKQPEFNPDLVYDRGASHARAGCPLSISSRAACTYNSNYQGYYVGGGVPQGRKKTRGEPRYCDEGVWGMDYAPFYSRVANTWSHGRLFQGGIGLYEPDRKNRPFGLTFGRHFGQKDRGAAHHSASHHNGAGIHNGQHGGGNQIHH